MRRYDELLSKLLEGRADGSLSGTKEDEMLEELDELWLKMTPEEIKEMDSRAGEIEK